jgi:hypothetical protein
MGMRQELIIVELACSYYSTSINGRCNPLERQALQTHFRNTATEEAGSGLALASVSRDPISMSWPVALWFPVKRLLVWGVVSVTDPSRVAFGVLEFYPVFQLDSAKRIICDR